MSNREYASKHADEFVEAIEDYHTVKMLVTASFTDKKNFLSRLNVELLRHIIDFALPGQGALVFASAEELENKRASLTAASVSDEDASSSSFRLCARCRPLMPWELEGGAYSCATLIPPELVLHDGKMARNGRRLTMTHKKYAISRVWPHNASNATICADEVDPLLARARCGFSVSLLCFGQTGTGKTYTLLAALHHTLKQLENEGRDIELTFFELHGKKAYDLLSGRKLVHLRSDENEVVHVRGAKSVVVLAAPATNRPKAPLEQSDEAAPAFTQDDDAAAAASWKSSTVTAASYASLWAMLDSAFELRSSEVTERNPVSSRSHAVCVVKLLPSRTGAETAETDGGVGKMTFVDLAGSERNYETTKMTPAQHRESADINFSLMALKDCFRAYHAIATGSKMMLRRRSRVDSAKASSSFAMIKPEDAFAPARAPYRASLLTRVLRECFVNCVSSAETAEGADDDGSVDRRHYTTIITTLSPTPTDITHGINSLEHVVLMQPDLVPKMSAVTVEVPLKGVALSHLPIESWSAEQVVSWLTTAGGGRFAQLALPPGLDGKGLMMLNMVSLSALFEGHLRAARQGEEGSAWVVDAASEGRHNYLGRALWAALRREQMRQRATLQQDAALAL